MKILNLFFIGLILYLCYKIFTMNEHFQTTQSKQLDLSGKNISFGKNLYINMDENKLEELNKLDIDLSKNNLLIDNKYDNKVSIKKELCIGNFCINKDKLKLIAGKIDAPQFYKTDANGDDKPVYYNHDCNINNKTNEYCNIETVKDLPNKMCFNYETKDDSKNTQNKLCIGSKEFDLLKGTRGIKLKHVDSNKDDTSIATSLDTSLNDIKTHEDLEKRYSYDKYLMPYYADFRETGMDIESTKDQLLFKNNHQCTNTSTLYKLNPNFNPRKYPYYKDSKSEINCENVDCNDPLQSRLCLHKCGSTIIDRENKKVQIENIPIPPEPTSVRSFLREEYKKYLVEFNEWQIQKQEINNKNNKNKKKDTRLFNIPIIEPPEDVDGVDLPEMTEAELLEEYPIPKIIDKDGMIVDERWERNCSTNFTGPNKQYCMNYKSNPIETDIDADIKRGIPKKDRRRPGKRKYHCGSNPNWQMEEGIASHDASKERIKNSDINIKNTWPEVLLYGMSVVKNWFDDTDPRKAKFDNVNDDDYKLLIANIKKKQPLWWGWTGITDASEVLGIWDGERWPVLKRMEKGDTNNWCCNHKYGRQARCGLKQSCKNSPKWVHSNRRQINEVNKCVDDYNLVNNYIDEFNIENNHGWYILPGNADIDPNYNGYYIDKNNNNTKYTINDNAVAKAAKFLGNIDNHRVSHDGVCGESNKDITNMQYFCNGPNSNNPLYNKVCNPITYQHSKIQQCMNEKRDVDIIDSLTSEPTTSIALTDEEQIIYNEDLETCIFQNSGDNLLKVNQQTQQTNDIIDSRYKELNELDELNFFIQPSNDSTGNIIKSNTYFHAHNHIHT
jgi:hypothetical protein